MGSTFLRCNKLGLVSSTSAKSESEYLLKGPDLLT